MQKYGKNRNQTVWTLILFCTIILRIIFTSSSRFIGFNCETLIDRMWWGMKSGGTFSITFQPIISKCNKTCYM